MLLYTHSVLVMCENHSSMNRLIMLARSAASVNSVICSKAQIDHHAQKSWTTWLRSIESHQGKGSGNVWDLKRGKSASLLE